MKQSESAFGNFAARLQLNILPVNFKIFKRICERKYVSVFSSERPLGRYEAASDSKLSSVSAKKLKLRGEVFGVDYISSF